jgi:hypothetical protein
MVSLEGNKLSSRGGILRGGLLYVTINSKKKPDIIKKIINLFYIENFMIYL